MTVHGITTTKANLWVHFHPLETSGGKPRPGIYLYDVGHCRDYIARHNPVTALAHSKDPARTVTATGYLIPKGSLFVVRQAVPAHYAAATDWANTTDREAGLLGERCVKLMLFKNEIRLPDRQLKPLKDRASQLAACDFELVVNPAWLVEIKTERVQSANLFVQTHEQGHLPTFAPGSVERITSLDSFT